METFPSTSSSTNKGRSDDDAHYLRKFLPCWRMLFPWAEYEEGETKIVYCCDCRNMYNSLQGIFTTMIGFVTWPPL